MDHIWKKIKQDVKNENWDTNGLQELFDKQLDVILIKYPVTFDFNKIYSTIQHNGDIVVGFYLDNNAVTSKLLQLEIGGQPFPDIEVQPGKFVYIFENTHIYPIISVAYSELHITTKDYKGLYVIYALIKESHLRREIATNNYILNLKSGKIALIRGTCVYLKNCTDEYNEIPDMSTS